MEISSHSVKLKHSHNKHLPELIPNNSNSFVLEFDNFL